MEEEVKNPKSIFNEVEWDVEELFSLTKQTKDIFVDDSDDSSNEAYYHHLSGLKRKDFKFKINDL